MSWECIRSAKWCHRLGPPPKPCSTTTSLKWCYSSYRQTLVSAIVEFLSLCGHRQFYGSCIHQQARSLVNQTKEVLMLAECLGPTTTAHFTTQAGTTWLQMFCLGHVQANAIILLWVSPVLGMFWLCQWPVHWCGPSALPAQVVQKAQNNILLCFSPLLDLVVELPPKLTLLCGLLRQPKHALYQSCSGAVADHVSRLLWPSTLEVY